MTIPDFRDLLENPINHNYSVYLWQDWRDGKDKKKILKEIDQMQEPAFREYIESIKRGKGES